jgi:hypothetical protein
MSFNPANFPFTMPALAVPGIDRTAARAHGAVDDVLAKAVAAQRETADMVQSLRDAASRFELRGQTNNMLTCKDLASKLAHYGSFASDKQAGYAKQLVEWSKPQAEAPAAAKPQAPAAVVLPKLFDLMQRLSKLTIGQITIARKNQDSLCWVKYDLHSGVIGKIENGVLHIFKHRIPAGTNGANVVAELLKIEADPEAAAVLHGKASGRCAVCSRDLTDPESIERGIGPVCAERF